MSGEKRERGETFADVVGDVRRIEDRDRLRPPPEPTPRPAKPRAPERRFVVERQGDAVTGRAEDVSRSILADLRAGRLPVERELDLHGLDLGAASRALEEAVEEACRDGARCLLLIHGRGRHSAEAPVLKAAVADRLQAPPLADRVQAFATAPPRLGGAGATLVLLRRRRERS